MQQQPSHLGSGDSDSDDALLPSARDLLGVALVCSDYLAAAPSAQELTGAATRRAQPCGLCSQGRVRVD